VNHAIVHYYRKDFDLAKLELAKLAEVKKDEPNIYNTLSLIETEKGNYQEALKMVNKAIELDPKQSYFLNNRGFVYLSLKEMEKAEADINESISSDPYNAWAYRNKGVFYLMKGDYPSAERLLKQSIDMDNFVDKIYFYLGMAYLKNGKTALACTSFKKSEEFGDKMMTTDLVKACK
jgi:tetratricopeptide (TPR) repeat protein